MNFDDTIFAPATPLGTGAISIIRLSGRRALEITDHLVRFSGGRNASSSKGGEALHGYFHEDGGETIDEVMVILYRAPHSFTGEDSAEICFHASEYIGRSLMQALSDSGARMAEPGEFTRRAFVNGKMDLAQAEAVADLIAAKSKAAGRLAMSQLKGEMSRELGGIRDSLLEIASLVELEIDFSEEDVEFTSRERLRSLLEAALNRTSALRDSFRTGNAVKNGISVTLAGEVNSGKSSLLNALLSEDRAIVSDIAGTTRDTVEETIVLNGVLFRLIDTAGIRETSGKIERIGISRTFEKLLTSEVCVYVMDATVPLENLVSGLEAVVSRLREGCRLILVRNKVDLFDAISPEDFPPLDRSYGVLELKYPAFGTWKFAPEELLGRLHEAVPGLQEGCPLIDISARSGEGLDALKTEIVRSAGLLSIGSEELIVTSQRHYEALTNVCDNLTKALDALSRGLSPDLLAEDLRSATESLGTITGAITSDEVLGNIFSKFCIGK